MEHLVECVFPLMTQSPSKHAPHAVFAFMSDRMRAVAQELTIQRCAGPTATRLLGQICKVLIVAFWLLRASKLADFDPIANERLLEGFLYQLVSVGQSGDTASEAELVILGRGWLALLKLWSNSLDINRSLKKISTVTRDLIISMKTRNWCRFFKLCKSPKCDIFSVCLLQRHWLGFRIRSLNTLNSPCRSRASLLMLISELLQTFRREDLFAAPHARAHGRETVPL
eukprot:189397_1